LGNEVVGPSLVLWKLNEPAAGVFASDLRGVMPDLDADGIINSRPAVELGGITGFGRVFAGSEALEGIDTASALRLTRSVTIQFLARFDLSAQDTAGFPGTVLSLGFRDSSPEGLQFLVELDVADLPTNRANVRMRWEIPGGFETTNAGADFIWPVIAGVGSETLLITVVREWRSSTDVIVRYYANDMFLGKDNSVQGDILGAAGATMLMGVRGNGAGGYENNLEAKIEAVAIFERVMTAEEIRQIARLFTVHDPAGYALMRASVPKNVYSIDPSSVIQRELFVDGQMWGRVKGKAAEMSDDFLPDRAWYSLTDWENVFALPPNPGDSVGPRRNRILSFLRAAHGHQVQTVKDAVAAPFDIDASNVEILEFTEILEDDFATGIKAFWQQVPDGHAITNPSGALKIAAAIGVHHAWAPSGSDHAPYVKANIDRDEDPRESDPAQNAELSVLIDSEVLPTFDETLVGVAFYDQVANSLLIWGIFNDSVSGAIRLGHVRITAGVQGAIVNDGVAPARPFHLNMKFNGVTMGATYDLGTATAAARNTITTVVSGASGPLDPAFVLLGAFGLVSGGPTAIDSLEFDDFRLFTPRGLRVFSWYAFRDPSLPGTPDMPGARKLITRIKPAHTQGAAVQTKALLTDDPDSLLDDGPLG
jgi:hypothetical protein